MTNQEAIENLNCLMSDGTTWTQYDCGEEIAMAVDALRKQIPMPPKDRVLVEPVIDQNGAYVDVEDIRLSFNCPVCGEFLGYGVCDPYCPRCGQALDLTEYENKEEQDG